MRVPGGGLRRGGASWGKAEKAGLEVAEIPAAVKNADVSSAMLAEKTTAVLNTKAEACTACDNSCLMHIQGALHRQRTGVRTVHLAEILARSEGAGR